MKAILILDEMPCACVECPFCVHAKFDYYFDKTICIANGDKILDTSKVQHMCPLKEMPQKYDGEKQAYMNGEPWYKWYHLTEFKHGWNACIEEIER